jgi:hypothetical protein
MGFPDLIEAESEYFDKLGIRHNAIRFYTAFELLGVLHTVDLFG